ncbi:plasmid pRiA4b ORF-3 family protein [Candidatus Poriferisodalis sp.]|uniref:plasmid pRiA4b ORF-3 family protein n=1 Tax=Candidatus Poriferisodalis sp. TaxID=3101277 RepID=UPI003B01EC5F
MSAARASKSEEVLLYELLITLDGAHVQIDRRVLVPGQATLGDLHVVIQLAMGWQDCHLHAFTDRNGTTYGDSTMSGLDFSEQSTFRVSEVLAEPGDEIEYEYDFGDSWHHRIELVQIRPDDGQCTQGARTDAPIKSHSFRPAGARPRHDTGRQIVFKAQNQRRAESHQHPSGAQPPV